MPELYHRNYLKVTEVELEDVQAHCLEGWVIIATHYRQPSPTTYGGVIYVMGIVK